MASKDFERMIKLGAWLEQYLDPDATLWNYKQLANDFNELYEVNHGITKNEITFKIIELIEKQEPKIKEYYKFGHIGPGGMPRHKIYRKEDPLKILEIIERVGEEQFNDQDDIECFVEPLRFNILNVYRYKEYLLQALELILESQKHWCEVIFELDNQQSFRTVVDPETGKELEHIMPKQMEQTVFLLSQAYGKIIDSIVLDHHRNRIILQKAFDTDGHHFSKEYVAGNPDCEKPSHFPWEIAAARVFFDFLFLEGHNYYLFCKQCGRFTVIRRKGRKKFCSDTCRTAYGREQRLKKQQ